MLKIQKPNGVALHAPKNKMVEIVLHLNGGGITEKQTRMTMLALSLLRRGNAVEIKGYTLQLEEDEHETSR